MLEKTGIDERYTRFIAIIWRWLLYFHIKKRKNSQSVILYDMGDAEQIAVATRCSKK